jgi:CheY-like chemotaxis protein
LTIATGSEVLARGSGKQQEPATARFACLEVADTGRGMPAEIKEHIFEPFFTTKEVGQGTGLGLSTAYGIVEQAGGHITVESKPERGTTFRVFLPIAATAAPGDIKRAPSPALSEIAKPEKLKHRQRKKILLVEDEAGIRAMTRVYLESEGYKVLEAADGNEALRIFREDRGDLALVLTDIIMPGMRGDELVRAIHKERPRVRAIFITGFAADALKLDAGVPVVEKPFTFPELGKRVREVLDQAESEEPRFKKVA